MLREDWEFFSAQRKMLKERIMKDHSCMSLTEGSPVSSMSDAITTCTSTISSTTCSSSSKW